MLIMGDIFYLTPPPPELITTGGENPEAAGRRVRRRIVADPCSPSGSAPSAGSVSTSASCPLAAPRETSTGLRSVLKKETQTAAWESAGWEWRGLGRAAAPGLGPGVFMFAARQGIRRQSGGGAGLP